MLAIGCDENRLFTVYDQATRTLYCFGDSLERASLRQTSGGQPYRKDCWFWLPNSCIK
jgi:hypothetical protein